MCEPRVRNPEGGNVIQKAGKPGFCMFGCFFCPLDRVYASGSIIHNLTAKRWYQDSSNIDGSSNGKEGFTQKCDVHGKYVPYGSSLSDVYSSQKRVRSPVQYYPFRVCASGYNNILYPTIFLRLKIKIHIEQYTQSTIPNLQAWRPL